MNPDAGSQSATLQENAVRDASLHYYTVRAALMP